MCRFASRTEEVLRRIVPEGLEVPRRFETVGHIAHLNLREELLPYRFAIARILLDVRLRRGEPAAAFSPPHTRALLLAQSESGALESAVRRLLIDGWKQLSLYFVSLASLVDRNSRPCGR